MKIKICGLTDPRETIFLNEAGADYAGFVFYEKSKRNITIAQAEVIREKLNWLFIRMCGIENRLKAA